MLYDLGAPGSGDYTITADADLYRQGAFLDVPPLAGEDARVDISGLLGSSWAAPAAALAVTNLDTGAALTVEAGIIGPISPYGRLRLSASALD